MTILECITIGEFTSRLVVTDYDPESYKYNDNCISSHDYAKIIGILRDRYKSAMGWPDIPLGNAAIDVLKNCNSNCYLFGFFFKLMAMSARMAAISGVTNVYNDYRVNNDLHALFFGFTSYYHGTPIEQCNAYVYVYATGKVIKMTKSYEAYMKDSEIGDLTSIGITPQIPNHLWKKNTAVGSSSAPMRPHLSQQIPQITPMPELPQCPSQEQVIKHFCLPF